MKKPLLVESSLMRFDLFLVDPELVAPELVDPFPLCPWWAIYRESKGRTALLKIWKHIESNLFKSGK